MLGAPRGKVMDIIRAACASGQEVDDYDRRPTASSAVMHLRATTAVALHGGGPQRTP